jgi:hypothetical protein
MEAFPHLTVDGVDERLYDVLLEYFEDPVEFRELQARTGTLISGSQALKIIGGFTWQANDLDLYVWPECVEEVKEWLVGQGYSNIDGTIRKHDHGNGVISF